MAKEDEVLVTINSVSRADLSMQLGSVTETVNVEATTLTLQTDRSEVRAEISSAQFVNLPVQPGRNYQQLFKTIPGFRPPTNAHSVPTNPSRALTFNVNGASYSINNTRIDGASSIAPWLPHATSFVPTLEAIETVNVVTNSFDAEQGLAGGAAINVQIKGGTNDLHGALFEYHTDNKLKAKNFFLPQGQNNPKLVFNEFGGVLGGPIKKNKLFYFVSYEGNYDHEFASRFGTVPTPAMKRGDMSESPRPVFDPATGDFEGNNRIAFANNLIPSSRFSPIVKKLVDLTPDPNQPGLSNNYFAAASYAFDRHRVDSKINYNHSDKLTAFGRFSILNYDMNNPHMFGGLGGPEISGAGGNPGTATGRTYSFTGAATYILKPNLIMDAYYGYTRMDTSVEQARLDEKLGLDFLGIPGTNGTRRFEGGWPQFAVSGFTELGIANAFMPYFRRDPQYQYVANFNWTKQNHELRFGMDLYSTHMNHLQPEATGAFYGAQGGFGFGGGPTVVKGGLAANNFNNYSTFLLGLPTNKGKITMVPDEYNTRSFQYSFYVRDRWNASRKLTLSYGLRWEYFPFPHRSDRGLELYDPAINKMLVCGAGSVPGDCGVTESKKKFAPRIGLAYRVTDSFVLRAGYGITNDPFSLARPFRTNYPVLLIQNIEADNSFQNVGNISTGIPRAVVPDTSSGVIDIPGTFAVVTADKNFKRGYVQSWNLTLQKQLKWGFVGQAGYVATRSTNQMGYLDLNAGQVIGAGQSGRTLRQKFGRTAATTLVKPFGTGHYDSLQATLERRFTQSFSLSTAYTWSKVIGFVDNNDSEPSVRAIQYFARNRTARGYDRTHNLHISNIWELPFGKGKKFVSSGPLAWVMSGWQLNNILSFYSGTPFTVGADGTSLNMPGSSQTADQVKPSVQMLGGVGKGLPFFDPFAFASVRDPRFGNTAMNLLRGPGVANWDFGFFRKFSITERYKLEFRLEAFNFTNTPHFNNPGTNVSSFNPEITDPLRRYGGFTEITGTSGIGRDGIDERQFRIGIRISF
ncbi:MAG: TonB-dependent receptor [Acidobacteria bacterium]|nr:TonB-dependent receptor [Acidobacteriota bacterium]